MRLGMIEEGWRILHQDGYYLVARCMSVYCGDGTGFSVDLQDYATGASMVHMEEGPEVEGGLLMNTFTDLYIGETILDGIGFGFNLQSNLAGAVDAYVGGWLLNGSPPMDVPFHGGE